MEYEFRSGGVEDMKGVQTFPFVALFLSFSSLILALQPGRSAPKERDNVSAIRNAMHGQRECM